MNPPLAERLRPHTLEQYAGQEHLLGPGKVLRNAIENNQLPSFILWGPPGVGKTSLALLISKICERPFFTLSAIQAGVKDIREVFEKAKKERFFNRPNPILFIDEIHRFSKSQQDALLGEVEKGTVTLIGATTENPSFEVIPALLSRCHVYVLKHLEHEQLISLIENAVKTDYELKQKHFSFKSYDAIIRLSGGDARKLYNIIELLANTILPGESIEVTDELVMEKVQQHLSVHDKGGEMHYDVISAFIKSIRGSDPNAAVYWLARMVEGGEDPDFICRRMIILASEDIGLANPNALLMAKTAHDAIKMVGWPEGRIILSQAAIYLATSPKSNSAYEAIENALYTVRSQPNAPVPLSLRNAPSGLMKKLDYGKDYKYAHGYEGNFVQADFLPEQLKGKILYRPGKNSSENKILEQLIAHWDGIYKYNQ